MTRLKTVPVVPFLRRHALLLAMAAFVISLVVIGCGGGGSNNTTAIPSTGFKQADATYVGKINCRDCHANIYDQYVNEQPMGINDPATYHTDDRHRGECGACHVTGFGQPTGGQLDGSTPQLDGIGCESCHGPGSKHLTAGSVAERQATITRVPPDKTCKDCHGDRLNGNRPGALDQPYTPVTADSLRTAKPNGIRGPHHAAAAFLMGRGGYNLAAPMESPHSTVPNTCQACHQKTISPITGKVDHGADAQHPDTNTNQVNCSSCHSGRSEQFVQAGVKEALIEVCGEDPAIPGEPDPNLTGGLFGAFVAEHAIDITTNNVPDDPYVIAYKGARQNVKHIMGEGSMGVHNPGFAKKLIDDAKALLATE